jgi:hypothetical protein
MFTQYPIVRDYGNVYRTFKPHKDKDTQENKFPGASIMEAKIDFIPSQTFIVRNPLRNQEHYVINSVEKRVLD